METEHSIDSTFSPKFRENVLVPLSMQKDSLFWEKSRTKKFHDLPKISNRGLMNLSIDWQHRPETTLRSTTQANSFRPRSFMSKQSPRSKCSPRSPIEKPRNSYIINHEKIVRDSYKNYRFKDYIQDLENSKQQVTSEQETKRVAESLFGGSIDINVHNLEKSKQSVFRVSQTPAQDSTFRSFDFSRNSEMQSPKTMISPQITNPSQEQTMTPQAQNMVEKLKWYQNNFEIQKKVDLKKSFDDIDKQKQIPKPVSKSIQFRSLEIDNFQADQCPYNLRYKHLQTIKKFTKISTQETKRFQKSPKNPICLTKTIDFSKDHLPNNPPTIIRTKPPFLRQNLMSHICKKEQHLEECIIRQTPQELIAVLDEKIQKRKDKLVIDVVSEACLKQEVDKKLYDVDRYQEEVQSFINKRLKFKYQSNKDMIYQILSANEQNCALHNLPKLQKYKYDQIRALKEKVVPVIEVKKRRKTLTRGLTKMMAVPNPSPPQSPLAKVETSNQACVHSSTAVELRQQFYTQYSMIIKYMSKYSEFYKTRIPKSEIIKRLHDGGYYDMKDLSDDELDLFDNKETFIRILEHPLLYMVKQDLKDLEEDITEQNDPVTSSLLDNHDQSIYELSSLESNMYMYTISLKAQNFLRDISEIFQKKIEIPDFLNNKEQNLRKEPKYYDKYVNAYEDVRFDLIQQENWASIDCNVPELVAERMQQLTMADVEKTQNLNYQQFMKQLQSYIDRYHEEFIINRSVGRLEPSQSNTRLITDYTVETIESAPKPVVVKKKNPKKLLRKQTQIDIQQLRQTTTKLFNNKIWQDKFFAYAKVYTNDNIQTPEEKIIYNVLKEYESQKSIPSVIWSKIQDQKLLIDHNITTTEALILGKFMEWTASEAQFNIKVLQITNCNLTDLQLSYLLKGVASQHKIISLNLAIVELDHLSLEPLLQILSRKYAKSLQELSIVGLKKVPSEILTQLFEHIHKNGSLSKFTFSQTTTLKNQVDHICDYFERVSQVDRSSISEPYLTHIDVSHLNLSSKSLFQIMKSLRYCSTLQFLSFRGNKLLKGEYSQGFNQNLCRMLKENTKYLTHLDLSEMTDVFDRQQVLNYQQILENLVNNSMSIQVIHFDNNFVTQEQKVSLAQKMGVLHYQQGTTQPLVINSAQSEINNQFLRKGEISEFKYLMKNKISHLLLSETNDDKILNYELQKHVKNSQNFRKIGRTGVLLPETQFNDKFTFYRDLAKENPTIKYKGPIPFIDNGQHREKWNVTVNEELCQFCQNLQEVDIYFDDEKYQVVTNNNIKNLLKKYFIKSHKYSGPVIFGSITNWKLKNMVPSQLFAIQLCRDKLLKVKEIRDSDNLKQATFLRYLNKMFELEDPQKLETDLRQILPNFPEFIDYELFTYQNDRMMRTNQFDLPTDAEKISYMTQIKATPGKHSVIIFYEGQFYCREIIVTIKMQSVDLAQQMTKFQQKFDKHCYDFFASQVLEFHRSQKLSFLKDMRPIIMAKQVPKASPEILLYFYSNFKLINDLFIHLAANQKIRIMEQFRDSKECLVDTEDIDEDNLIYPTVQATALAPLFGSKKVKNKSQVFYRYQFLQYILQKVINGFEIQDILEVQEPENYIENFGFRYYEKFLRFLDPFTQEYLSQNLKKFEKIFLQFSLDQNLQEIDKYSEISYKQLGYISLDSLKKILEIGENLIYKNVHNYILKLRASVGINQDYFCNDDNITMFGATMREHDRIQTIIQTKELEDDAKTFLKDVVDTKNFEQKQIEKKINRQFKYTRSRFFNVDFMEFLQIMLIHNVILSQTDDAHIELPGPKDSEFWQTVHNKLTELPLFSYEIQVQKMDLVEGEFKTITEKVSLLTPLSADQCASIKTYCDSTSFRFNLLDADPHDDLRLPETYTAPNLAHLELSSGPLQKFEKKVQQSPVTKIVSNVDQIIEEEDDFTSDFGVSSEQSEPNMNKKASLMEIAEN